MDHRRLLIHGFSDLPDDTSIFEIAHRTFGVSSDAPEVLAALALVMPSATGAESWTDPIPVATVVSDGDLRILTLHPPFDDGPDEIEAAARTADFPLEEVSNRRHCFATPGGREVLRRNDALRWEIKPYTEREILIALIIYHRILRLVRDAIFFHASSVVSPSGSGAMFIGRKGAGKSTTALALADGDGWALLGDETAWYEPATHRIGPFLRPVGIKPGPRSARVDARLRKLGLDPEKSGPLRAPAESVARSTGRSPVPLSAIFLLAPFAEVPRIESLDGSTDVIGNLQPVISSILNAGARLRTFQLASMVSRSKLYRLRPGSPHETSIAIKEVLS